MAPLLKGGSRAAGGGLVVTRKDDRGNARTQHTTPSGTLRQPSARVAIRDCSFALATNVPLAHLLNASRPLIRGAFYMAPLWKGGSRVAGGGLVRDVFRLPREYIASTFHPLRRFTPAPPHQGSLITPPCRETEQRKDSIPSTPGAGPALPKGSGECHTKTGTAQGHAG